jgi:hypothetical protein
MGGTRLVQTLILIKVHQLKLQQLHGNDIILYYVGTTTSNVNTDIKKEIAQTA